MSEEQLKLKRMEYLQDTLHKYLSTDPRLELRDIAEVISGEIGIELLPEFKKLYKQEDKKW